MTGTRYDDAIGALIADAARHTGHGVLFYDRGALRVRTAGEVPPFCRRCLGDPRLEPRCRATYEEAAANALSSAEPFYYTCWAGLLFAAVAVAPFARCLGCAAVSGFRAAGDALDDCSGGDPLLRGLRSRKAGGPLGGLFAAAPVISPSRLRGLGAYLQDACFASGLNSAAYFRRRNAVYLQQRAIAEFARLLKPGQVKPSSLVRRAEALAARITRAEGGQRGRSCAAYLAAVLQACAWDLERLKAHLRVPMALLTRDAVLRGGGWSSVARDELRFAARLDQGRSVEDVCYAFFEILSEIALRVSDPTGAAPALSERVVRWLERNYSGPATITAASRAVGASASSIIKRVKHDTGKTFHQLLLEIRLAEAKRLLATTHLDLIAIAQQCGFFDQSHFTRHLRKAINLAPGQFRKLMVVSEEEALK